ncbi:MAG: MFS transporter [Hyphomicrobiaceae bacterium]
MHDNARQRYAGRPALFGWIMFDWAAQPVFLLVQTFFFGPYFVAHFIGNPVVGQTLWSWVIAISGAVIAIMSPVFGAIADRSGRRKIWIAAFSVLLIAGGALLWLAVPGSDRVPLIMAAVVLTFVGAEFATVFTNAMLPSLVPLNKIGRLSGTGWATGYAGGLIALILFLALFLPGPAPGQTMLGVTPLVPLDVTSHEPARLTGPIAAFWYLVFVLPFFVLTPDLARRPAQIAPPGGSRTHIRGAIAEGFSELYETLTHIRANSLIFRFLLARMLYADGLSAIFAFGAIYAASTFGWGTTELGLFAILLSITGLIGALLGGMADDRFGSRTVIVTGLIGLLLFAAIVLSIDRSHVGWFFAVMPTSLDGPRLASTPEWMFIAAAAGLGLTAGPIQSSSRSMMARLTPPEKASEFFGFFAFSGKATAFAAPAAVGLATYLSGSQRIGMSVIAVFIVAGFLLLISLDLPRGAGGREPVNAGSAARP